jgi:transcriptional regulatory protein GAL4
LQHLLAKYAPELDLDDELRQRSESETVVEGTAPGSSMRRPPLHPSPTGTFPLTDWASTLSPGRLPTVAAPRFSPNQQTPPPPPVLYPRPTTSTSTSEFLEKQPKHAAGYEWNERQTRTAIGNDGTASLSMEPDGEGYLGKPGWAGFFGYHAHTIELTHRTQASHLEQPSSAYSRSAQAACPSLTSTQSLCRCNNPNIQINGLQRMQTRRHSSTPISSYITPTTRSCMNRRFERSGAKSSRGHLMISECVNLQSSLTCTLIIRRWEMLLNVLLGIGAFCSYQPMYIIDYFLERATSILNVEQLESGSLTLVQAFCLLSNLTQKRNKPNAGSVYLGE